MVCKNCGNPIGAEDAFCAHCGNAVQQETDTFEQDPVDSDGEKGGLLKTIGIGFLILITGGLIAARAVMSHKAKSMNETNAQLVKEINTLAKKRFQDISTPALNELFGMRLGAEFTGEAVNGDSTNILVGVFFPDKNSVGTNTLFSARISCQDINSVDFSTFLVFLSKSKRIQAVRAVAEFRGDKAQSQVDEKCEELIDQICKKLNQGARYDSTKITKKRFKYLKEANEEAWGIQCKSSTLPQDIAGSPRYNTLLITKEKVDHNTYLLMLDLGYESHYKEMSKEQSAMRKEPTEERTGKVGTQVNINAQLKMNAQLKLGEKHANDEGVEQAPIDTVKWYRKAAEQGNADAQCHLGICYHNGEGVEKDEKEAVRWLRKAADQGNIKAQCLLGACYLNGEGVEKNAKEAARWFYKAAEQGDAAAQNALGVRYDNGDGVPLDKTEATRWYRKAAEQGYAEAQCNLGTKYEYGEGVSQDKSKAASWYRKAAEQGCVPAQCNLGWMYEHGAGVIQDKAKALIWYRKAAEQGLARAQNNLGTMYDKGDGVAVNKTEAMKWYRKAAEQGDASGQCNLGAMYEYGTGVRKDMNEAIRWYRKSAEQGCERAIEKLCKFRLREYLREYGLGVK